MRRNSETIQTVKATQQRIFRLAERDHGLTRKAISLDSGINYDSVCNYAKGETEMSVSALVAMVGVIPDELLSLLLPEGRVIVRAPEGLNHDQLEEAARDYIAEKAKAHHPLSPAGREISPCEQEKLDAKIVPLRSAA